MHSPTSQVEPNGVLSARIDKELQKASDISLGQVDLLVLGDRDIAGRWELLKRLKVRYGMPMDEAELRMYIVFIRSNIMETMRLLCILVKQLGLEDMLVSESASNSRDNGRTPIDCYRHIIASLSDDQDCEGEAEETHTKAGEGNSHPVGPTLLGHQARRFLSMQDHIQGLWKVSSSICSRLLLNSPFPPKTTVVQFAYGVLVSSEAVDYIPGRDIMDDIPRIASPLFRPTEQDIVCGACLHSVGLLRDKYPLGGDNFNLHFATGRSAERQKWIGRCHNVDCVVLVVDLSSYDVYNMSKEGCVNELAESFDLIRSICTRRALANKPVMLILNKVDIFTKKVQSCSHISDQEPFKDYTGPLGDATSGCRYFVRKFKKCLADHSVRDPLMHTACVAETKDIMHFLEDSVRKLKLERGLRRAGFLDCISDSPFLPEQKVSRSAIEYPGTRKTLPWPLHLIAVKGSSEGSSTLVSLRRSLWSRASGSFLAQKLSLQRGDNTQ